MSLTLTQTARSLSRSSRNLDLGRRTTTLRDPLRAETEALLHDLAFVLQLTRRVKESILEEPIEA